MEILETAQDRGAERKSQKRDRISLRKLMFIGRMWRVLDVTAHYGFYVWIWIVGGGDILSTLIGIQIGLLLYFGILQNDNLHVLSCMYSFLPHGKAGYGYDIERKCNIMWCITSILAWMIAMFIRDDGVAAQFPIEIIIIVVFSCIISVVCNLYAARYYMNAKIASATLEGCNNLGQLCELLEFGYKVTIQQFNSPKTWLSFREPLELYCFMLQNSEKIFYDNFLFDDRDINYDEIWRYILKNEILSERTCLYWKTLFDVFSNDSISHKHVIYPVDYKQALQSLHFFLELCEIHDNLHFIRFLIEQLEIEIDLVSYRKYIKYKSFIWSFFVKFY